MEYRVVGKCGNCGGQVLKPTIYMGVTPPPAQCERCKAIAKPEGTTLEMEKPS